MKMPTTDQCIIHAYWGPRQETPEALAVRFLDLLDRLSTIDPVFSNWLWVGRKATDFREIRDSLPDAIEAKIIRADDGDPTPIAGYSFSVINSIKSQPRSISVRVHAGSWGISDTYINDAYIETHWRIVPDPALITFPVFRAAVLALAESFGATWCGAHTGDVRQFWGGPRFRLAWMSYVGPRFAPLITPPPSAIVERRPNGGLLMAATDETFTTANPVHLAAARDILAAIAPLNALPWPPDAKPAPDVTGTSAP